jgi:hypothetical protein
VFLHPSAPQRTATSSQKLQTTRVCRQPGNVVGIDKSKEIPKGRKAATRRHSACFRLIACADEYIIFFFLA